MEKEKAKEQEEYLKFKALLKKRTKLLSRTVLVPVRDNNFLKFPGVSTVVRSVSGMFQECPGSRMSGRGPRRPPLLLLPKTQTTILKDFKITRGLQGLLVVRAHFLIQNDASVAHFGQSWPTIDNCSLLDKLLLGIFSGFSQVLGTQVSNMPISQNSYSGPFGSVRISSAWPS